MKTTEIGVELMLFDREVHELYGAFLPLSWAAADLRGLEFDAGNGSEIGTALAAARERFAAPSEVPGADWVLLLSDLELRRSFVDAAELELAAGSAVRIHVVRPGAVSNSQPAAADEPWRAIAEAGGGLLWDHASGDQAMLAAELVRPRRLWSPRIVVAHGDGTRREQELGPWLDAGETLHWLDHGQGSQVAHAGVVGEVWGRRRAWVESPSPDAARRVAAQLVSGEDAPDLSDAALTALAMHAAVVSPWTSAWAVAPFAGAAPAPQLGYGYGYTGGHSSFSTRCGGARGIRGARAPNYAALEQIVAQVFAACPSAAPGSFAFETTGLEIVEVESADACLREAIWALDMSATSLGGRQRVSVDHDGQQIAELRRESVTPT